MKKPRKAPRSATYSATSAFSNTAGLDIDVIIEALRNAPEGVAAADLDDQLELNAAQRKALPQVLSRLQGCGMLRRQGRLFRYSHSPRVLVGTIRQRRRKTITFVPDDLDERARGRIRIAPEETGGAYDSDRVIVALAHQILDGVRDAKVEMILRRGLLRIVGRLHHGFRDSWVESLDEKFPVEIDLIDREARDLDEGWIVEVEITRYPSGRERPAGRIVERLGSSSEDPGMDIEIVIHKHDLPVEFPSEVLAESNRIPLEVTEDHVSGRLDLRHAPTVTIDGETARDFDDAISLTRLASGNFHLGVHIADVSYYVKAASPLDVEARMRGTSVYFPERAIPMLPERLSNGICSLKPNVDRLTMSALMEVDRQGRVVAYELRETVIRSSERMTYTDVNQLLAEPQGEVAARYAALKELFQTMRELAEILIRMREQRGAIDFNLPESVFEFDDEGRIGGVIRADRHISHRIIEEFMLLANETVAGHLARLVPSLFRIHEEPKPQRVTEFAELAAAYGYKFPASGATSKDYQRLSRELDGKPEERVLAFSMLRSLERARYAAKNLGHFGLAAPVYTHFTSPIRRYPDLIVHRILRAVLKRGRNPVPIALGELEQIADESSERERAADAAERELDEWRKAVFMAGKVGEEFDALIINVREFGFFVELEELFIEGLVSVSTLADDYYLFDERRHTLSGRNRRRTFKLGDRLKVRLERVNVDRHLVDFSVVRSSSRK